MALKPADFGVLRCVSTRRQVIREFGPVIEFPELRVSSQPMLNSSRSLIWAELFFFWRFKRPRPPTRPAHSRMTLIVAFRASGCADAYPP